LAASSTDIARFMSSMSRPFQFAGTVPARDGRNMGHSVAVRLWFNQSASERN
jgi:hypothetical protein